VVALVRDRHHVRAEAQLEQQLRRVGHEAHDPHDLTVGKPQGQLRCREMTALSDEEIGQRLTLLPGWRRGEGQTIVRDDTLADFAAAIAFVDRVAVLAEAANHHPDILLHGWNKVRLTLSTHSQGALTEADFSLAAAIDGVT
jgi:4a-hydroxytetrahydrobiopterin dehydratase